jgi:DNA-binding response OmpR family regulator
MDRGGAVALLNAAGSDSAARRSQAIPGSHDVMRTIFRFEDIEIDAARLELGRGGSSIEVGARVLRLLSCLAPRAHGVVARANRRSAVTR